MNGDLAIDVRGLTKHFGSIVAVDHIGLQVRRGEICGFLGPNGSGKTTFIRMLCGLLRPDDGEGTCLGHDVLSGGRGIKEHVGYMTQKFSFWEDLTVRENLEFVARLYALDRRRERVAACLDRFGLAARRDQQAGQLSGGWKQRLALAACMIHEPRLLLLDEPTAGVDPKARRDFWEEIHRLAAEGLTFLITTHYMDEAERCHRIAFIARGRMLAHGTVGEVVAGARLNTWAVRGPDLAGLANRLRALPGIQQVVPFGNTLHVSGANADELENSTRSHRVPPYAWESVESGLEDVFIHLMDSGSPPPQGRIETVKSTANFPFSPSRFWAIVVKEFIQMRRDRLTFGMMVGIPLIQLILFGYAINADPKHLPTAIVQGDHGVFGRSLVMALRNSSYFDFVREVRSEADGRELLQQGKVQFLVHIPEDFTRSVLRGERPPVLLEADATDPAATGNAFGALRVLVEVAFQNDLKGSLASLSATPGPVELRVHAHYNPENITQYNIVPGLMGVVLTLTMILITGLAITRERERGTMENLLSMPTRPLEVMVGKIIPYIFVGYIQVGLILCAAKFLFKVPIVGSLPLLLVASLVFIAANLAVGITFSTIAQNQLQAMQMTFFFFLPSLLLSGFFFPFRGMPGWAQVIGEALPLTHYLRVVRGILLKGNGLPEIGHEVWPIALFATALLTIATKRYRQTLD